MRCEKCAALVLQKKGLKRLRLLADNNTPLTCSSDAYLLPRLQYAVLCRPHLLKAFSAERNGLVKPGNVMEVQKYIRSNQFEATSRFQATQNILDRVGPKGRKPWSPRLIKKGLPTSRQKKYAKNLLSALKAPKQYSTIEKSLRY
jgi:hypothetical protein